MRRAALLGAMLLVASLIAGIPASASKPTRLRVVKARGTGAPALVSGIKTPPRVGSAPKVARDYLSDNPARYGISDPERELTLLDVVAHEGGRSVRFQQLHRGVPVFGAHYLVHIDGSGDGKRVTMVNGDFFTDLNVLVDPRLSPADARTAAFADIRPLSKGRAEDQELVVLPVGDGVLTHHLTVVGESLGSPLREQVFVDAVTGSVVLRYNDIKTAGPVMGSGVSVKDPGPTLPLGLFQRVDGSFEMRDLAPPPPAPAPTPPPVEIVTHNAEGKHGGSFDPDPSSIVESPSSTFSAEATESGAVDAHWGARRVFDFYASLGRNSLDGEGMPIVSVVNASDRGDPLYNASWNGEHITYGNPEPGDDGELYPMSAALDIVAHELTHGVNEFAADFVYLSQSGALDEAYADYVGNAVEVTTEGTPMTDPTSGYIGEDVCRVEETTSGQWTCPFLRDLNDGRGTDDYLYYLYDFDEGGVHDNATIYAGALWEIREDLVVRGYSAALADRIIYRALTSHAPLDSFFDGRLLVEAAAQEIGLAELTLAQRTEVNNIVDDAFDERGIDAEWDAGTDNDTLVLLEDTNPLGFAPSVPRVSGQRFVTVHYPDLTDFCCGPGQLFIGDVTGAEPPEPLTVSDDDVADEQPDIGGGIIVWSRFSDGDRDVIATTKGSTDELRTVAGTSSFEWYPSVDGNLVAWENRTSSQTDIYGRYGRGRIRKLTQTSGNEINPQVAGDTVAWWDLRKQVPRIGITNLKTGGRATIKLSRPRPSAMIGPPAVTGKYVFWYQDGNGDGRGAIMRANHKGKRKTIVVAANSGFAPVWTDRVAEVPRPSANNSWVVYTSEAGFLEDLAIPSDEVGRDIFMVPADGGTPAPVTCNRGDQAYPDLGKGQRTVWFDGSRGRTDLVTRPSPPTAPCG